MTHHDKPRIELNWVQALAAPLAAVTSAVLLSTFGVAGTLIGAALGSLALTVGNAVYAYSIKATKRRVAVAQTVAAARIGLAQSRVEEMGEGREDATGAASRTAHDLAETREDLDRAQAVLEDADPDPAPGGWRSMLVALPWRRIVLLSTAIFVAAMLMIVAFELTTGRALSSYTGSDDRRTSIPGWGDRSGTEQDSVPQDEDAPAEPAPGAPGAPGEEDLLLPSEGDPTADTTAPTQTAEPSPAPTSTPVEPSPESVETAPAEPTPGG
jgi:hypothetical protein